MNEEPTKSLSSNNFNLFDLNKSDLEACNFNGTSANAAQNIYLENGSEENFQNGYFEKCKSQLVHQELNNSLNKLSKIERISPLNVDSEQDELFNIDEEFNDLNDCRDNEFFDGFIDHYNKQSRENFIDSNGLIESAELYKTDCSSLHKTNNIQQVEFNSNQIKKLNKNDYFTITIARKLTNNYSTDKNTFVIESACENSLNFLRLAQNEVEGKNFFSLMKTTDQSRFKDLFQTYSQIKNSNIRTEEDKKENLDLNTFKLNPFVCQLLVSQSSSNKVKLDSSPHTDSKNFETMLFIPSKASKTLEVSQSLEPNLNITFVVKYFKNNINTAKKTALPSSMPLFDIAQQSNNCLSSGFNECNKDQFKTKMKSNGSIISAEIDRMKNSFCDMKTETLPNNSTKNGLIIDVRMGLNVNFFDYVHSNDLNHINQHIQNVLSKTENTSAIYRLKINQKFAFLQTQSKLISKTTDSDNQDSDKNIICSIHSIIKEIDNDGEMKGNASTSLMKTLIGKKPSLGLPNYSQSCFKPENRLKSSNMNNLIESLEEDESNVYKSNQPKSPSNKPVSPARKTPLSPIGTKFALTMLGVSSNPKRIDLVQNDPIDDNEIIHESKNQLELKKSLSGLKSSMETSKPNEESLKKKKSKLNEQVSSRKNNVLLKKLLSEGNNNTEKRNENDQTINKNELTSYLSDKDSYRHMNKQQSIDESLLNNSEQTENRAIKTKAKDDIILRTLLNTSDLEPQFLKLDSIFDLNTPNNNQKKEELLCETQNQPSNFTASRNIMKHNDSLGSELEPRYKRKKIKKDDIEHHCIEPNRENDFTDEKEAIKKTTKNKRNLNRGLNVNKSNTNLAIGKKNKIEDMQSTENQKNIYQSKAEKMNYSNYLNKENDSTNPIDDLLQCQDYQNQWNCNNSNSNKKIKIDVTSQENCSYYLSPQKQVNKCQRHKEETTFPSSLTSSTISVSSSSSLSSPGNNNMISLNSNINDPQTQTNENQSFMIIAKELLDDFHLTQPEQLGVANVNNILANKKNDNENDDIMLNQLEQVLSIKNTSFNELEKIVDFDSTAHEERVSFSNLNLLSSSNKIDESGKHRNDKSLAAESAEKLDSIDDDLTKKKRIEAISKHLKFDLLESFKSSNQLTISKTSSSSSNMCSPTASQISYQRAPNESFDQDLNGSFNSNCLSPIPNNTAKVNKNIIGRVDENFTPNLTIESNYTNGSQFLRNFNISSKPNTQIDNNQTIDFIQNNQIHSNQLTEDFISYSPSFLMQQSHKNDPAQIILKKKLQERIHRNSNPYHVPNPTVSSPNPQSHYQSQPNQQSFYNPELKSKNQHFSPTLHSTPSKMQYHSNNNLTNNLVPMKNQPYTQLMQPSDFNQQQMIVNRSYSQQMRSNSNDLSSNSSQHQTKSQYGSYELQENNDSDVKNSYNFSCSSPINNVNSNNVPCNTNFPTLDEYDEQFARNNNCANKPYGGNDFVKKQLGNTVNKRLNQQQISTKQDKIPSYQYNTGYMDDPYSKPNEMLKFQQYSMPNNNQVHYPNQMHYQQNYNNVQPSNQYYSSSNSIPAGDQSLSNSQNNHYIPNHYHQSNYQTQNDSKFSMNQKLEIDHISMSKSQKFPNNPNQQSQLCNDYNNNPHIGNYPTKNIHSYETINRQPYKTKKSIEMTQNQSNYGVNQPYELEKNDSLNDDFKGSLLQQLLLD